MIQIAIDGACRENGKPTCRSCGGVFITDTAASDTKTFTVVEDASSNQRGELLALRRALQYIAELDEESVIIVTDSEYVFNIITKGWYKSWRNNSWLTSQGEPVKNLDLIESIVDIYESLSTEVMFYHIKGHVIPIGPVTARKMLEADSTGAELYIHCMHKFDVCEHVKQKEIEHVQELSERNNLFRLQHSTLRRFVAMNCAVDAVASNGLK